VFRAPRASSSQLCWLHPDDRRVATRARPRLSQVKEARHESADRAPGSDSRKQGRDSREQGGDSEGADFRRISVPRRAVHLRVTTNRSRRKPELRPLTTNRSRRKPELGPLTTIRSRRRPELRP
jgi:hypothetical protein